MWGSCSWGQVEVVRWESLAALRQESLCWPRGRWSTWSLFFFCFCFAFTLWVSIHTALLSYTVQLISNLSLNCCYSFKIISAELRANMRASPYLKGLSWNCIVRNSRKLLKTVPFAREGCVFQNGQNSLWPPPPYFWNHFADFWAHVNICALQHLFIQKEIIFLKAMFQHSDFDFLC